MKNHHSKIISCLLLIFITIVLFQIQSIRYFCLSSILPLLLCSFFVLYLNRKTSKFHPILSIGIVTAISIFLHLYNFIQYSPDVGVDSKGYIHWASQMVHGNGFPNLWYRPPLYPFFIGIIFKLTGSASLVPVVLIQHILLILCVPLLYILARLWNFPEEAAILSSLLFSFNSLLMQMATAIMSETLFIFLLLVSMVALTFLIKNPSIKPAIYCGTAFSLLSHCRQIASPLLFICLSFFCFSKPRKFMNVSLITIAAFLICGIPWSIRNLNTFGSYGLSYQLGPNIFTKICSYNLEPVKGRTFDQIKKVYYDIRSQIYSPEKKAPEDDWELNKIPHLLIDSLINNGYSPSVAGNLLVKASIEGFFQNKAAYISSIWKALCTMLFEYHDIYPSLEYVFPIDSMFFDLWIVRAVFRGIATISGFFLFLFPVYLLLSGIKLSNPVFIPFYITVFGYLSTSFIHVGFTRYTIPWQPFFIMFVSHVSIMIVSKVFSKYFPQ